MRVIPHIFSLIVCIFLSIECLAASGSKETNGSRILAIILGVVVLGGLAISFISQVNQKGGGYASGLDSYKHQQSRSDGHILLILFVVGIIFLIAKACG